MSGNLSERPLGDLLMRRQFGKLCIRICVENDAPEAEAHYREQLRQINDAIKQKKWGGQPPAQTIGLNTLTMKARRN